MFHGTSFFCIILLNLAKRSLMAKVALITGSAVRIGCQIARHLAGAGWDLGLHYRSSSGAILDLKTELRSDFPDQLFHLFQADFESPDSAHELINMVIDRFGHLDLLVNNASVFEPSSLRGTSNELMIRQMKINLISPFILMRDYANSADNGHIINILDTRITNNRSGYLAYSLSKKALWELTQMAALELAPNFRVNAIAPGAVLAPVGEDHNYLEKITFNTPMKTSPGIISVLKSIDYIIGNQDITGQVIFCDGGAHLA
jgi:pteridine reductase